jgi:sulfofructose kinase
VAAARVLLVDHSVAGVACHAARHARAHGIPVVADVELASFPEQEAFLDSIDHLIVNLEWARRLSGAGSAAACAEALLARGHTAVVVTQGAAGSVYAERGQSPVTVPVLPIAAVDTTGCGDVFHGAYAACLAAGGDVPTAVRWATVAAGLKTRQPGGRAGIPTRAEVEAHLARLL